MPIAKVGFATLAIVLSQVVPLPVMLKSLILGAVVWNSGL